MNTWKEVLTVMKLADTLHDDYCGGDKRDTADCWDRAERLLADGWVHLPSWLRSPAAEKPTTRALNEWLGKGGYTADEGTARLVLDAILAALTTENPATSSKEQGE